MQKMLKIYQGKGPTSDEVYELKFGQDSAPLVKMLDGFPKHKQLAIVNFIGICIHNQLERARIRCNWINC